MKRLLSASMGFALAFIFIVPWAGAINSGADTNVIISKLRRPLQFSLNGKWHMREDPDDSGESEAWFEPGHVRGRVGLVPLPWQLAFEDLREYLGVVWYERNFELPQAYAGKRIAIEFLGITYHAKIWVNGRFVGEHEAGLTSFILDVSDHIRFGKKNTLTIKVTDPKTPTRQWTNEQVITFSGIWRDVYLEITDPVYVSDIFMIPDIAQSVAKANISVSAPPQNQLRELTVALAVTGPTKKTVHRKAGLSLAGPQWITLSTDINDCVLWEPDRPAIYEARVSLLRPNGEVVDTATTHFGMRKIEARGRRIYLNNQPIYLVGGWLDPSPFAGPDEVNWACPGPYQPLSDEDVQRDIQNAKSLNINLARRILRSINPRFIYWADRLGLLVWSGGPWMPARGMADRALFDTYKQRYEDIIIRDRNHPSIVIWELFCESFGLVTGEYSTWKKTVPLIDELYDHVKTIDGTRLVLDNACGRGGYDFNYLGGHAKTDIDDIGYLGLSSTAWIQSAREFRDYCRLITSYGKPVTNSLLNNKTSRIFNADKARRLWAGKTPWWFTAPSHITTNSSNLTGYEDRYYRWGFDEIYGDFASFTHASDRYQFEAIKFQAEEMRKNPHLVGYLSFLFDCIPHVIGAIDPFRDKKTFCNDLANIYRQDLIMVDCEKRSYWSGESIRAHLVWSHFGKDECTDGVAEWRVEGHDIHGRVDTFYVGRGDVRNIGTIEFNAPEVEESEKIRVAVSLRCGESVLSENHLDLFVFSRRCHRARYDAVNLMGNFSGLLSRRLDTMGYDCRPGLDANIPVTVTNRIDENLIHYMEKGGRVVLLVGDELDLIGFVSPPTIPPATGFLKSYGLLLGDREFHFGGITGSHFIRRTPGLFDRIPFANPIAWPFENVMPKSVLIGLRSEQQDDILAGAYGSFLRNSPADDEGHRHECEITGTIVQFRYGKGRLIVSTFDLLPRLALDPVATVMFNDLVAYAGGDFQPRAELIKSE